MIELQDLSYIYAQNTPFRKTALNGVNLRLEDGAYIGLIGHTGSGKSTLVQQLNGLLRPTSGRILLDGVDIWAEPKKIRSVRFAVGLVFQYPEHQLFEETVRRDIAFGPTNMGLDALEVERRVRLAMEWVGLKEELADKSPFELSGGQRRRVAIAGVMAMMPRVLVLDEPTAGLDPRGRDKILGRIDSYHRETGSTILLVSHSMEDIAKHAKEVIVMSGGGVAMQGSPRDIFEKGSELEALGLGLPQITRVMQRLQALGLPVDGAVHSVEAAEASLLQALRQREVRHA